MSKVALTLGLLTGISWATLALAADPFAKGVTEWSFSVGYGDNFGTSLRGGNVQEDVKFVPFLASWGKVFKKRASGVSLGYAVEGFFSHAKQESVDRSAVGITPLFVYNFKTRKKLTPYAEMGIGIVFTDLDPEGFGSDFGFTPQAGIGIRYAIGHDRFLKFSYRYHHLSNAGLKDDNKSIDSNFFLIGYSFLR
ncbi:MAG: acyloxyacyl hydrolase [Acidiferrobacterales bacterium]